MSNTKEKILEELRRLDKKRTLSVGHLWLYKGKEEETKAFFQGVKQSLEHIEKFVNSLEEEKNE